MKRVVITGMGLESCIGDTLEKASDSLKNGKSGVVIDEKRNEYGFYSPLTGYIDNDKVAAQLKAKLKRKQRKTMGMPAKYAYLAAERAVTDSGLDLERLKNFDVGVIFGNDSVSGANVEMWDELRESRETRTLGSGFIFQIMNSI